MKKLISLLLVLSLMLCGCAASPVETVPTTEATPEANTEPTTEATTEPTTEPTTVPTTEPPVFYHPLNGQQLDAPYTGRIVACTVANTSDDIPHVGVNQADILFEAYVSYGVVRCLALFSDASQVEAMGSIRSTRLVFNDIAQHYDALLIHGGGSGHVLQEAETLGIDHLNVDSLYRQLVEPAASTAYRTPRRVSPYNLYGNGPGILTYAESVGIPTTRPEDTTYGLTFAEDGTPVNGETANEIHAWFGKYTKDTTMTYDPELGKYVWVQYWGQTMRDEITDEVEAFKNILLLRANTSSSGVYQVIDFESGGEGYYASNGKYIPIMWNCADATSPIRITTLDGEEVALSVGNTYIGVLDIKNEIKIDGVAK